MLPDTDRYLIDSIKKGDFNSFEILFRSYYSLLCRYAAGMLHNEVTAEDLVSDVLVKIWEFPDKINIHTSLKGFLVRSVHNTCLNYLNRKHKRFQELDAETIEKLNTLSTESQSEIPSDQLIGKELEAEIEEVIKKLPTECSRIFLLSRREALSHAEIAEKLNITENTVKVQIYRALSKIKTALKNYLD